MKLADVCIDRPVFATMLVTSLVVLGAFSYTQLGVDLLPRVDIPAVVITVGYPGAGPEEVENQVTRPIEDAVNTVAGLDELRSTSFEGLSQVIVTFKLEMSSDVCVERVRDRIGRIQSELPQTITPPVISGVDPDASPVLSIVVAGKRPIRELTDFVREDIKKSIESLDGVGQVTMVGGRNREVHIELEPDKLTQFAVTPQQVRLALQAANVEMPGGVIKTGKRNLVLRMSGRIRTPAEFAAVPVTSTGGTIVYVGDLGKVVDAEEEEQTLARLNGKPAVALQCLKQSGSNTVQVIANLKAKIEELRPRLPADIDIHCVRDQSVFILASFHAVMEHLMLGAVLASLVVLLFLRDLRTTVMVVLSIPTSLISTFLLMHLMGFSLNNMTLLALALAVGLVIDDAIVVHENAYRHMEELRKEPKRATREATDEIGLAVIATTLSLVVIFLPIAFMPGIMGRFMQSFGLTMAFAIMVSLVVSFTLTPMLCAHFLKVSNTALPEGAAHSTSSGLERMLENGYVGLLRFSLAHRWFVILVVAANVAVTPWVARYVGVDFMPVDDQSEYTIHLTAPQGTSLQETSRILSGIEAELAKMPETAVQMSSIGDQAGAGVNVATIYVGLCPPEKRTAGQLALMERTRQLLKEKFKEVQSSVEVVPMLAGAERQSDLTISLRGVELDKLRTYAEQILKLMHETPGLVDVHSSLEFGRPEISLELDRPRAAALGISVGDVGGMVQSLIGGDDVAVTRYHDEKSNQDYQVRVVLANQFRDEPQEVGRLPLRSNQGFITLGDIGKTREGTGPTQIDHYARSRQVMLTANLNGVALGDAQKLIGAKLKTIKLDTGYTASFQGMSKSLEQQQSGFLMAFMLSALFVYMILAAQFESLVYPISILLTLPLCIPFGIQALACYHEHLNLYSMLGLFMLFGIVKKNAILQVDYTNQLREQGQDRLTATLEANRTRLRPILMTTLALVAGMTPMVFGEGPGSTGRRGMAIVVGGGQTLCLVVTLVMTPVAYSIFDDIVNSRIGRWFRHLLD